MHQKYLRLRHLLLGIFCFLSALVGSAVLVSILYVYSQFGGNASLPADCGLVFGTAVHGGGEAGPGITRRTNTAARLWKEEKLSRLIFTGGVGEGNLVSEAHVMRNEALRLGIDPEAIRIEESSMSTWQNLAYTKAMIMDCKTTVAISDRYHLARIRSFAWRQGIALEVHPADTPANTLFEIRSVLREAALNLIYLFMRIS